MIKFEVLDSGSNEAEANMQMDRALLDNLSDQSAALCQLHLYQWKLPSATYGYFLDPSKHLFPDGILKHRLQLAKRPTGGGLLFHSYDLTFSVLLTANHPKYPSNTLEGYRQINQVVGSAVQTIGGININPELLHCEQCKTSPGLFCMAKPTVYDLVIDSKKIAGAAQRRTKHGLLHQGSIALMVPPESFLRELIKDPEISNGMLSGTYPLLPTSSSQSDLASVRKDLSLALIQAFDDWNKNN